ncbi:StAR- lipid transfer protein 5 [Aphanomyces cochlioides]|nr:StAR- lipid transfer protein 5 [Aphanomyces cochlioides]
MTDARIISIAEAAVDEFDHMCRESKSLWRAERCGVPEASIWSKPGSKVRIFQAEAILAAPPSIVFDVLHVNVAQTREWNTSVDECSLVKKLAPNVEIMLTLTFAMYGGLVSARDFVNVRMSKELPDGGYIVGTTGIEYEGVPVKAGVTRGMNGVMGFLILPHDQGTRLVWIINTDVKGWILRSLIDAAIPAEMESYILALRKHVATLQA